ncbi:Hypothetical protein A7982_00914 [Minicystis rosea]|nr:Hypothetical protein A7982_00914 [Minicystis rosea]
MPEPANPRFLIGSRAAPRSPEAAAVLTVARSIGGWAARKASLGRVVVEV